jgi:uncharacterized protein
VVIILIDASALLRRYDRTEPGARRVRAVCAPSAGHTILLAQLAPVEIASGLSRKVRQRLATEVERDRLWQLFQADWRDQYQIIALTDTICAIATRLVRAHPLKALDAIHVGSALLAARDADSSFEFWTADRQQAAAAEAEGLAVELVA